MFLRSIKTFDGIIKIKPDLFTNPYPKGVTSAPTGFFGNRIKRYSKDQSYNGRIRSGERSVQTDGLTRFSRLAG